ncbi:MAG: hypothetical protein IJ313_04455 [Clostridia bacterium]|nr:hypothetical protein [Clostridia bacterium]
MGFKQPRVPEYRSGEGVEKYIRTLILFLKDFCQEAWRTSRAQEKAIDDVLKRMESVEEEMAGNRALSTSGEEDES